ncbi:MAG: FtsQ-type POTRA domain-containing protein [Gemmatimonadetes bacterium]|nr:FtsQ-type POTRA domain-containing protein [Gemmatimonadota bacterium]MYI06468.1 FtsQ-type POTRA domain-containing protein [Gemmatimonadota bacterium]
MKRTVRRAARRIAGFLGVVAVIALVGWGAVLIAGASPYFRVDRVEVTGLTYLTRDEVRAAAGVDGATSVWARRARLLEGLVAHPMVESARVTRDLPRTLLFEIEEAEPVGLVALPLVMAVDRHGNLLDIDPGEPVLDLPVLRVATERAAGLWGPRLLAREVARMAEVAPELFAVISEARLDDRQVTLLLGDSALRVRYHPPITEERLRDAIVAMNDAAERFPGDRLREVDLRFADQVVVRTVGAIATGSES